MQQNGKSVSPTNPGLTPLILAPGGRYSLTTRVPILLPVPGGFQPTVPIHTATVIHPDDPKRFLDVKALWDTGASHTSITKRVAQQLGLVATSSIKTIHVGGKDDALVYRADLRLPGGNAGEHPATVTSLQVSDMKDRDPRDFDLIIGMNIIMQGDFALTGGMGSWRNMTFRSPSAKSPAPAIAQTVPGRNDRCPCGSGRKYKKCHGDPKRDRVRQGAWYTRLLPQSMAGS